MSLRLTVVAGPKDIHDSVALLLKSRRGRAALRCLRQLLDEEDCASLDGKNQEAILLLLAGVWGSYAGTTIDALRCSEATAATDPL